MTLYRVRIVTHNQTLEFIADLSAIAAADLAGHLRTAQERFPDRIRSFSTLVESPFGNAADLRRVVDNLESTGVTYFNPRRA